MGVFFFKHSMSFTDFIFSVSSARQRVLPKNQSFLPFGLYSGLFQTKCFRDLRVVKGPNRQKQLQLGLKRPEEQLKARKINENRLKNPEEMLKDRFFGRTRPSLTSLNKVYENSYLFLHDYYQKFPVSDRESVRKINPFTSPEDS